MDKCWFDVFGFCMFRSSGLLYIMANGYIRTKVNSDEIGKAIALSHALRSLNGALSPTVGGHLISISYSMIGYFGVCTQLLSIVFSGVYLFLSVLLWLLIVFIWF